MTASMPSQPATMSSADRSRGPRPSVQVALLVALALLGQVWLLATAWLLPAVSEFTLIGDNVSELVLGRFGFLQQAAFVIGGVGTLAAAWVIRRATAGAPGSLPGSILEAVYGCMALVMAVFPTDRVDDPSDVLSLSRSGMVHVIGAVAGFLSALAAMAVLFWSFRRDGRWRALTPWIGAFPVVTAVLLITQSPGPMVGLLQRLLVSVISAWLVLIVLRARAVLADGSGPTAETSTPSPRPTWRAVARVGAGVVLALLGLLWLLQGADLIRIEPILCVADCQPVTGGSVAWSVIGVLALFGGSSCSAPVEGDPEGASARTGQAQLQTGVS